MSVPTARDIHDLLTISELWLPVTVIGPIAIVLILTLYKLSKLYR